MENIIPPTLNRIKYKRHALGKHRTNFNKKYRKLNIEQFWILNPSNNINQIRQVISALRKRHGLKSIINISKCITTTI